MKGGGDKSRFECPKCDTILIFWEFGEGWSDETELGLGCENDECEGYEEQPDEMMERYVDPDEKHDEEGANF